MTVQLWAPGRWQVSTWKEDIVSTGLEDWAQDIRSVEKKTASFYRQSRARVLRSRVRR
jgi:hypothetical protein